MGSSICETQEDFRGAGFGSVCAGLLLVMAGSQAGQAAVLSKEDVNLYGYVDASYTSNFNNPKNAGANANQLRIFDGDANSFRPHMAQLVFEKKG